MSCRQAAGSDPRRRAAFGRTVSAEFHRPPEPRRCVRGGRSCRPDRGCQTSRRTGSPSSCSAFATAAVRRVPTSHISWRSSRGHHASVESVMVVRMEGFGGPAQPSPVSANARRAITVGLKCNGTLETLAQGNLGAQQDREPSQPSPDRLHHVATRWISARNTRRNFKAK